MENIENQPITEGFWHGDCLELMSRIPSASVDMVLCDLPYGTTVCAWDSIIPFDRLWAEYWRIAKPRAAIVLSGTEPFSSALRMSSIKEFKYDWIWCKTKVSGFTNAKNKPLNGHEVISVFSKGTCANKSQNLMPYFPQNLVRYGKMIKNTRQIEGHTIGNRPSRQGGEIYEQEFTNYPKTLLEISSEGSSFHPTQKPIALFEYLIKTYTEEGMTVLDNCAGSGTTAIAAINTKRNWICMERDPKYYQAAMERVYARNQIIELF